MSNPSTIPTPRPVPALRDYRTALRIYPLAIAKALTGPEGDPFALREAYHHGQAMMIALEDALTIGCITA
jgi:hypothetical protein